MFTIQFMRYSYFILIFLFTLSAASQSELAVGVVLPKVQLDTTSDQSYALYLPRGYDENKKYPVVLIFDEYGEGAKVVQKFSIAAGLTNSIIIGANSKFDDSLQVGLKKSEVLLNTTFDRYAIDRDKIVLAGYGKGGLVASTSAQLSNTIHGIIVIGDAFFNKKLLQKNPNVKISILSPDEGRNFYKLRLYGTGYTLKKYIAGMYTYDGIGWPDAGYLSAALTDILLEENTPEDQVNTFYENDMAFGMLLYRKQLHLEAFEFIDGLRDKYRKRLKIDEQKEFLKEIRANKSYRAKRDRTTIVSYAERLLAEDFNYYLAEDSQKAYFDNLGWWSYQMDDLDAKIDSTSTSKEEKKAAIRLKKYVQGTVEQQYDLFNASTATPEHLLFLNILRTLVNPLNQDAYVQTIGLSAREGDNNAALFYLEELLKLGYTNYDSLYKIPYTTALRISPEWNEIVQAYLGKSKYY